MLHVLLVHENLAYRTVIPVFLCGLALLQVDDAPVKRFFM